MDADRFVEMVKKYVERSGSQQTAASRLGVSPQYLNDVVHGRREPGARLAEAMGMERRIEFVKRGQLNA
jgi:DNA-binding transcriptional regulator YdaS (Cro superfamily)